jgi:cytochrome P450
MSIGQWSRRTLGQVRRRSPFAGDIATSRVPVLGRGRPSLPFPHPWNYTEPIRILDTFFWGLDGLQGSARHNRYLDLPGLDPVLVTREPAVIKAILSATGDKAGQFERDTMPTDGIARATGEDSLLYSNGPLWRRQKKVSAAPFSRTNLFQDVEFHAFETTFRKTIHERLAALAARQAATGETSVRIPLEPEIKAVMLEMLVNNFFGGRVPYAELRDRYAPSLTRLIDFMVTDTVMHHARALVRRFVPKPAWRARAEADFEELTSIALAGRGTGAGLWKRFQSDVPDERLRSNVRVFLAGALEATTSFASWAISHLARAPEVQERIHVEVRDLQVYDPENLARAVTLNRALEETLRLTPALYFLPRRTTAATTIATDDGRTLVLPARTHVLLDVWHANRCEEFWGVGATGHPASEFAPARWEELEQRGATSKATLHFGFGFGPRVCPGKFLGQLEVGLVVGAFVKVFRFTAPDPEPVAARAGVSTKPADGVAVELVLREAARVAVP